MENYNPRYGDPYFSNQDGLAESRYVFLQGNDLPQRLEGRKNFGVGETGFGTGLNFLCLVDLARSRGLNSLSYYTFDEVALRADQIGSLLRPFGGDLGTLVRPFLARWEELFPTLQEGVNRRGFTLGGVEVDWEFYLGDALGWSRLSAPSSVEAWFLDGHAPFKNPRMWSEALLKRVYERTLPGGTLATYTAAGVVKETLRAQGFLIHRRRGFGPKRHSLQGRKPLA